ncbi:hypothetical protein K438DRAFT_1767391 [Mycena galopus ATCC 62051]|nr:hypothetical protein K438DRAFT_1767391 [Mycena galopus ATCC 62051]
MSHGQKSTKFFARLRKGQVVTAKKLKNGLRIERNTTVLSSMPEKASTVALSSANGFYGAYAGAGVYAISFAMQLRSPWRMMAVEGAMRLGALSCGCLCTAQNDWPAVYWMVPWCSTLAYATYRIARPNPITFLASVLAAVAMSPSGAFRAHKRKVPNLTVYMFHPGIYVTGFPRLIWNGDSARSIPEGVGHTVRITSVHSLNLTKRSPDEESQPRIIFVQIIPDCEQRRHTLQVSSSATAAKGSALRINRRLPKRSTSLDPALCPGW